MNNPLLPEILKLNIAERIQLVEDIWDSISDTAQEIDLTKAQKTELDRRLETFQENPQSGATWDQVKQRLQNNE
ncbi:MAG: addiction module protein [Cyanobacteria bacterium P01_A01_bin.83]